MRRSSANAAYAVLCAGTIGASPAAHAEAGPAELTATVVGCYQHLKRLQVPLAVGADRAAAALRAGAADDFGLLNTVPFGYSRLGRIDPVSIQHDLYAAAMAKAAAAGNVRALKVLYMLCQAHKPASMQTLKQATDAQILLAARHAAACYPPHEGSRLPRNHGGCMVKSITDARRKSRKQPLPGFHGHRRKG